MTQTTDPAIRFWKKVEKTDYCWVWIAGVSSSGYGAFYVNRKIGHTTAHRWSYEQVHGPQDGRLDIDHLCRNRLCVRPEHLEAVTSRENCLRGISPAAQAAARSHCARGHEYTAENTYYSLKKPNARRCVICNRENYRRWKARKRIEAAR